jgi:hypothetical protein
LPPFFAGTLLASKPSAFTTSAIYLVESSAKAEKINSSSLI